MRKTWVAPETEPFFAWVLSLIAATCGLVAVGHWQLAIFLAPLLNVMINVLMVGLVARYKLAFAAPKVTTEAE